MTGTYRAELRGGPKDGWRYDFDMLPDPATWIRQPALHITGFADGQYRLSGMTDDAVAIYVWEPMEEAKAATGSLPEP